ncbi:MAG: hypothetical protein IPH51_19360 [Rubrivivax sp.]|nr:hypothetical protein [Rubrivivax sp.]
MARTEATRPRTSSEVGHRQRRAYALALQVFQAAPFALARVTADVGLEQVGARHLLQVLMAEHRHRRRVGLDDPASPVQHQRGRDVGEELFVTGFGGGQRGAGVVHFADIAHHAPVALEETPLVKARFAAGQVVALATGGQRPGDKQVAEGLAGVQVGLQAVQGLAVADKLRHLPGHFAVPGFGGQGSPLGVPQGGGHQTVATVDFPIGICSQAQQALEALFADLGRAHLVAHHARNQHATGQPRTDGDELGAELQ